MVFGHMAAIVYDEKSIAQFPSAHKKNIPPRRTPASSFSQ